MPSTKELSELYDYIYDYSWFAKRERLKRFQARQRARKVKRFIPVGGKTLDIGCGHGFFVSSLLTLGYDSFGYEYNDSLKTLNEDDRIFYTPSLEAVPEFGFDFISAWHSIEHMPDPVSAITLISSKLSSAGKAMIVVPNHNCIGRKVAGRNWVWLQQPYVHLWHFNPSNIRLLFKKSGLRIDRVWTRDTWDGQMYDWSIKMGIEALKLLTRQAGKEWFLLEEALRLLLTPFSYALNPIHKLLGTGSELIVLASKR